MNFFRLFTVAAFALTFPVASLAENQGAKNVILMVADGIGFNGWLAADYYRGQAGAQSYQIARPDGTVPRVFGMAHGALNLIDENGTLLPSGSDPTLAVGAIAQGYDPKTRWNRLEGAMRNDYDPVTEIYTSYTDSAAAGTALMSGHKTANNRINMDWSGTRTFTTIADIAIDQGRAAGVVTSVMIPHATPAATIAHSPSRNRYSEIFNEMASSRLDVIMGAGHPYYDNSGNRSEPGDQQAYKYVGGAATFDALTSAEGLNGFTVLEDKADFAALANGDIAPKKVLGLARAANTLQAARKDLAAGDTPSGMAKNALVPELSTMSLGALNVLGQDGYGFFLLVEGGAVDWMAHNNNMPRLLEEQIAFNAAVTEVIAWVEKNSSWEDTLLIVTSDHESGGVWGLGTWTNSVGGPIAKDRSEDAIWEAGYDPSTDTFNEFLAVQDMGSGTLPGYMFASLNHTNELVPLWALGAGSDLFANFTRSDARAAQLWGETYRWDGRYVDNTTVFRVMKQAFTNAYAARR